MSAEPIYSSPKFFHGRSTSVPFSHVSDAMGGSQQAAHGHGAGCGGPSCEDGGSSDSDGMDHRPFADCIPDPTPDCCASAEELAANERYTELLTELLGELLRVQPDDPLDFMVNDVLSFPFAVDLAARDGSPPATGRFSISMPRSVSISNVSPSSQSRASGEESSGQLAADAGCGGGTLPTPAPQPHQCPQCCAFPGTTAYRMPPLSGFTVSDATCCSYEIRSPFQKSANETTAVLTRFLSSNESVLVIVGDDDETVRTDCAQATRRRPSADPLDGGGSHRPAGKSNSITSSSSRGCISGGTSACHQTARCACYGSGKTRLARWLAYPGRFIHGREVISVDSSNTGVLLDILECPDVGSADVLCGTIRGDTHSGAHRGGWANATWRDGSPDACLSGSVSPQHRVLGATVHRTSSLAGSPYRSRRRSHKLGDTFAGTQLWRLDEKSMPQVEPTLTLIDSVEPPHFILHALHQHQYFRTERAIRCPTCSEVAVNVAVHKTIVFARRDVFFKFPLPCPIYIIMRRSALGSHSASTTEAEAALADAWSRRRSLGWGPVVGGQQPCLNAGIDVGDTGERHAPMLTPRKGGLGFSSEAFAAFRNPSLRRSWRLSGTLDPMSLGAVGAGSLAGVRLSVEKSGVGSSEWCEQILSELTHYYAAVKATPVGERSPMSMACSDTFITSRVSRSRAEAAVARHLVAHVVLPSFDLSEFQLLTKYIVTSPKADVYMLRLLLRLREGEPVSSSPGHGGSFSSLSGPAVDRLAIGNLLCLAVRAQQCLSLHLVSITAQDLLALYWATFGATSTSAALSSPCAAHMPATGRDGAREEYSLLMDEANPLGVGGALATPPSSPLSKLDFRVTPASTRLNPFTAAEDPSCPSLTLAALQQEASPYHPAAAAHAMCGETLTFLDLQDMIIEPIALDSFGAAGVTSGSASFAATPFAGSLGGGLSPGGGGRGGLLAPLVANNLLDVRGADMEDGLKQLLVQGTTIRAYRAAQRRAAAQAFNASFCEGRGASMMEESVNISFSDSVDGRRPADFFGADSQQASRYPQPVLLISDASVIGDTAYRGRAEVSTRAPPHRRAGDPDTHTINSINSSSSSRVQHCFFVRLVSEGCSAVVVVERNRVYAQSSFSEADVAPMAEGDGPPIGGARLNEHKGINHFWTIVTDARRGIQHAHLLSQHSLQHEHRWVAAMGGGGDVSLGPELEACSLPARSGASTDNDVLVLLLEDGTCVLVAVNSIPRNAVVRIDRALPDGGSAAMGMPTANSALDMLRTHTELTYTSSTTDRQGMRRGSTCLADSINAMLGASTNSALGHLAGTLGGGACGSTLVLSATSRGGNASYGEGTIVTLDLPLAASPSAGGGGGGALSSSSPTPQHVDPLLTGDVFGCGGVTPQWAEAVQTRRDGGAPQRQRADLFGEGVPPPPLEGLGLAATSQHHSPAAHSRLASSLPTTGRGGVVKVENFLMSIAGEQLHMADDPMMTVMSPSYLAAVAKNTFVVTVVRHNLSSWMAEHGYHEYSPLSSQSASTRRTPWSPQQSLYPAGDEGFSPDEGVGSPVLRRTTNTRRREDEEAQHRRPRVFQADDDVSTIAILEDAFLLVGLVTGDVQVFSLREGDGVPSSSDSDDDAPSPLDALHTFQFHEDAVTVIRPLPGLSSMTHGPGIGSPTSPCSPLASARFSTPASTHRSVAVGRSRQNVERVHCFISGAADNTLSIFSMDDCTQLKSARIHQAPIADICASNFVTNRVVVSCDTSGVIIVSAVNPQDLQTAFVTTWSSKVGGVGSLHMSYDGSWLCCVPRRGAPMDGDGAVMSAPMAIPISEWTRLGVAQFHTRKITSLHITACEGYLFTGGADGVIYVWDLASQARHVLSFRKHAIGSSIVSITTSSDGLRVASSDNLKFVQLWRRACGTVIRTVDRGDGAAFCRFLPYDYLVVRTRNDLRLYDCSDKLVLRSRALGAPDDCGEGTIDFYVLDPSEKDSFPDLPPRPSLADTRCGGIGESGGAPRRITLCPEDEAGDVETDGDTAGDCDSRASTGVGPSSSDSDSEEERPRLGRTRSGGPIRMRPNDNVAALNDTLENSLRDSIHEDLRTCCFVGIVTNNDATGRYGVDIYRLGYLDHPPVFRLERGRLAGAPRSPQDSSSDSSDDSGDATVGHEDTIQLFTFLKSPYEALPPPQSHSFGAPSGAVGRIRRSFIDPFSSEGLASSRRGSGGPGDALGETHNTAPWGGDDALSISSRRGSMGAEASQPSRRHPSLLLAATAGDDLNAIVWNWYTQCPLACIGHTSYVNALRFWYPPQYRLHGHDRHTAYSNGASGRLSLTSGGLSNGPDVAAGAGVFTADELALFRDHDPTGRYFATLSSPSTPIPEEGEGGLPTPATALCIPPPLCLLATSQDAAPGSKDASLRIFEVREPLHSIVARCSSGHGHAPRCGYPHFSVPADDRMLSVGAFNRLPFKVRLANSTRRGDDSVQCIAVRPSDGMVCTAGAEVVFWRWMSTQPLVTSTVLAQAMARQRRDADTMRSPVVVAGGGDWRMADRTCSRRGTDVTAFGRTRTMTSFGDAIPFGLDDDAQPVALDETYAPKGSAREKVEADGNASSDSSDHPPLRRVAKAPLPKAPSSSDDGGSSSDSSDHPPLRRVAKAPRSSEDSGSDVSTPRPLGFGLRRQHAMGWRNTAAGGAGMRARQLGEVRRLTVLEDSHYLEHPMQLRPLRRIAHRM